jgi:hypothetical protein
MSPVAEVAGSGALVSTFVSTVVAEADPEHPVPTTSSAVTIAPNLRTML